MYGLSHCVSTFRRHNLWKLKNKFPYCTAPCRGGLFLLLILFGLFEQVCVSQYLCLSVWQWTTPISRYPMLSGMSQWKTLWNDSKCTRMRAVHSDPCFTCVTLYFPAVTSWLEKWWTPARASVTVSTPHSTLKYNQIVYLDLETHPVSFCV